MPSQAITLVGTGLTLGCLHVLTGPDHMSALMTLSANSESRLHAFLLGIRWGVGHSTGLLLVGLIFLFITIGRSDENIVIPDNVSHIFESIVGVFMIVLGLYGIIRAREKLQHAHNKKQVEIVTTELESAAIEKASLSRDDSMSESNSYGSIEDVEMVGATNESNTIEEVNKSNDETKGYSCDRGLFKSLLSIPHGHSSDPSSPDNDKDNSDPSSEFNNSSDDRGVLRNCTSRISTRTMSFFAGVIHGLAGPGGVLGVIPAVQLHDARLATIYLASFCLCSMLTMGTFAVIYGSCSKFASKYGKQTGFVIESLSACLSIIVGILWLILLSVGKLDDVFP